jgi:hypothetical protein
LSAKFSKARALSGASMLVLCVMASPTKAGQIDISDGQDIGTDLGFDNAQIFNVDDVVPFFGPAGAGIFRG